MVSPAQLPQTERLERGGGLRSAAGLRRNHIRQVIPVLLLNASAPSKAARPAVATQFGICTNRACRTVYLRKLSGGRQSAAAKRWRSSQQMEFNIARSPGRVRGFEKRESVCDEA